MLFMTNEPNFKISKMTASHFLSKTSAFCPLPSASKNEPKRTQKKSPIKKSQLRRSDKIIVGGVSLRKRASLFSEPRRGGIRYLRKLKTEGLANKLPLLRRQFRFHVRNCHSERPVLRSSKSEGGSEESKPSRRTQCLAFLRRQFRLQVMRRIAGVVFGYVCKQPFGGQGE